MLVVKGWCTVKILVLSDSHSGRSFMRYCIDTVHPECVIHLGDHYEDGAVMAQEYPHIQFYLVPGNCDRYRMESFQPETLSFTVAGVRMYMTHGHLHKVKMGLGALLKAARDNRSEIVLYGHTHRSYCAREEDGLWVMNPGSCGSWGGSVGILEIDDNKISACYIVEQADLEVMRGQV